MAVSQSASKLSIRAALSYGRYVARALLAGTERTAGASAAANRCCRHHHLLSALSGFPKDLRYGPSGVLRKDGFGDDACFIARHNKADVVGVADGVGGWRTYGIDPSRFSRSLMRVCAHLVTSGQFEPACPAELIAASYKRLHDEQINKNIEEPATAQAAAAAAGSKYCRTKGSQSKQRLVGSSTACIVVLDRTKNCIHTANIGDSGFLVVRDGHVVHRSREQQHYFNAPFQLSIPLNQESSGFLCDSPDSAEITSFDVQEGDLIVVATDGLFDNMPTHLIEKQLAQFKPELKREQEDDDECSKNTNDNNNSNNNTNNRLSAKRLKCLQQACNSLALQARQLAMDCNHMSPFAQKAQQHGIPDAMGGKPDDITLILALVTSQQLERVDEETDDVTAASNFEHGN